MLRRIENSFDLHSAESARVAWFLCALMLITGVMDGGFLLTRPLLHQLALLPITAVFGVCLWQMLRRVPAFPQAQFNAGRLLAVAAALEVLTGCVVIYEGRHFASFGYHLHLLLVLTVVGIWAVTLAWMARSQLSVRWTAGAVVAAYLTTTMVSILSFPLTYLRSDMLPVIEAADAHLLAGLSPYAPLLLGGKPYDFPYLPGMLVAYAPFVAAHVDVRWGSVFYLALAAVIAIAAAKAGRRAAVAALLAIFLLSPFLQYRHDLYLQPHWLTLIGAAILLARGRHLWAALVLGLGMAIYQFSWILLPFLLLFGLRRRGIAEVLKLTCAASVGAMLLAAPFLRSATKKIASNTVGQWGRLPHALADPMNLSYWVTYLVAPAHLLRLQAAVMIVFFVYCVFRGRCTDAADTLRCMVIAMAAFVLLNVLVDGYFFLMLLVLMLAYVCVANGWWERTTEVRSPEKAPELSVRAAL